MSTRPAPAVEPPSHIVLNEAISKLNRDLKSAAATMTRDEARFLVDSYYTLQDTRIRLGGQMREMKANGEPHVVLAWSEAQADTLEGQIAKALDTYSNSFVLGRWARSQYGIGPVITAGLLAHIDLNPWHCMKRDHECVQAKPCTPQCSLIVISTAGAIWRFAGLDPTSKWEKGGIRPWNAALKVLCWKIGESFLKQSNRDGDVYGHILMARKELETSNNAAGKYATQAAEIIARVPNHKQKAYYAAGKLSPGHILSRSKRYATKLFLAHFFEVAYELKFKTKPPLPYILTPQGGHAHKIEVPNWPMQGTLPSGIKDLP